MTLLISFEGIDGSGKTSLVENLKKNIPNCLITREPRGTELGLKVWQLVDEGITNKNLITNKWSQFFLFAAAHNEHVRTIIKPNLEKGRTILVDRYVDSTFVYQGIYGKLGVNPILEIFQKTVGTPLPDLTFVLDIDPIKARERIYKRKEAQGESNNWDNLNLDFHQQIRQGYLKLKEYFPKRIHIVNAEQTPEEILREIEFIIKKK